MADNLQSDKHFSFLMGSLISMSLYHILIYSCVLYLLSIVVFTTSNLGWNLTESFSRYPIQIVDIDQVWLIHSRSKFRKTRLLTGCSIDKHGFWIASKTIETRSRGWWCTRAFQLSMAPCEWKGPFPKTWRGGTATFVVQIYTFSLLQKRNNEKK